MIGHSGTCILGTYAKAIDEFRREAIRRFDLQILPYPAKQSALAISVVSTKPFLK